MSRYVLKFSKTGYIKYTSHLDLLRTFNRAFRKTKIALKFSQGFNPHPKMSFAQPLSLGYQSRCELIEFETVENIDPSEIIGKLQTAMPEGIEILSCKKFLSNIRSISGETESAEYKIWIPTILSDDELKSKLYGYMEQDEIIALKKEKKSKALKPVNIKDKIRSLEISKVGEFAMIDALVDQGSTSNLSPELIISSFLEFAEINTPRYEVEVDRIAINFGKGLSF